MVPRKSVTWLYPEECQGPFYAGWWLYLRDRPEGVREGDMRPDEFWGEWHWLRDSHQLRPVEELLKRLGHADAPVVPVARATQGLGLASRYGEWFRRHYPGGLAVLATRKGDGSVERYEKAHPG